MTPIDARTRMLERALFANLAIHAIAMLGMALVLLPALPGGTIADDAERVAWIAAHPLFVKLGWLPWQLTAAIDLWLSIAMVRARFIPRGPAIAGLLLTVAAILPDQAAQIMLMTRGLELARGGELDRYLTFERFWFPLTAAWAATFYTCAAIAWSVAFARAKTWNRALTRISIAAWSLFAVASVGMLLHLSQTIVSLLNAIAFALLELWLLLVLERVLERARVTTAHGRWAPWKLRAPGSRA